MRWEQLRIDLTQVSSIGQAQVCELRVAQRGAHQVHVTGGADGVDKRQQLAALLRAGRREVFVSLDRGLFLLWVVQDSIQGVVVFSPGRIKAADGRALAHAAGVKAHQVEALVEVRHRARRLPQVIDARGSWPSGVGEDRKSTRLNSS